jgi:RNA polymerase sigma-70 factor, ECF subfamily
VYKKEVIMESYREEPHFNKFTSIHVMDPDHALELIMNEYGEEIKRFIFTYTKNRSLAEDLTQEVFVNVYLKLHTFNEQSTLRTWIYSIAINKCKDYFKSWYYKKVRIFGSLTETNSGYVRSPEEMATLQAESIEMIERILSLPIKYREVLLLYYYREFSLQEIMEILDISESTAKSRLHRGRKKLKEVFINQTEVKR